MVDDRTYYATSILSTIMGSMSALMEGTLGEKETEDVLHGWDVQTREAIGHLEKIREKI